MGLKKGMTNNPYGRPAGSVNKVSKGLRERVNLFLDENFELVQQDFRKLEPKDKLLFYLKMLSFGLPTLKAIDHTGGIKNKLDELSNEQLNEVVNELILKFDR